jgi:catechol 2,3-dioxygenase-like lactoylglutathione lyase family enzyme
LTAERPRGWDKEKNVETIGDLRTIILFVEDMDAQVRFYREKLGLAVKAPRGVDDFSRETWVELDGGTCTLALHSGGKDAPQFSFLVDEVLAAREVLLRHRIPMYDVHTPATGVELCSGTDPEGNRFSIVSRR